MAERSVLVRLRAEIGDYLSKMGMAEQATRRVGDQGRRSSQETQRSFGGLLRTAQDNRAAWTAVGTGMVAVGAAVTGVGVAAAKTGIEYNTLQQTTRAALTSLLGSAEAANEQMDKLDDFARNSPFSKATFISAQQQMLAFGIEAQKVVPYLDAIQNAVAAAGGSNADIEGIVATMSKIQSSAKITAQDLNEFGNRGVNAAEIIGSQMNMTGAEIRESITDGSLDATQALDALSAGMITNFEGAADGVKDTFAGAMDRVTAAWRDFSAELVTPLVNPDGGGGLVGLLNWAADAMRAFESMPAPIKTTMGVLAGLTSTVGLLGGGFLLLAPRVAESLSLFRGMMSTSPRLASGLSSVGKAAGAAGAALGIIYLTNAITNLSDGSRKALPGLESLTKEILAADEASATAMFALPKNVDNVTEALDALTGTGGTRKLDLWASKLDEAFGVSFVQSVHSSREAFEQYDSALAALVQKGNADEAARGLELLYSQVDQSKYSLDDLKALLPGYQDALAGVDNAQQLTGESAEELAEGIEPVDPAVEAATEALEEWRDMVAGSHRSFIDLGGSFQSVIDKNREVAEEAAAASKSTKDSWEDFYDGTTVKMKDWIADLEAQAEAQANWRDNILKITSEVREQMPADLATAADAMVDELIEAGPEGAAALQAFADATPKQRERLVRAWQGTGDDIVKEIEAARNPVIKIEADGSIAERDLGHLLAQIDGAEGTISVEGDIGPASEAAGALVAAVDEAEGTVTIYGEDGEAVTTLKNYQADVNAADGTVTILGEDEKGRSTVVTLTKWIDRQGAEVKVDADTSKALKALKLFRSEASKDVTTTLNGKVVYDFAKTGSAWGDGEGMGYTGKTPQGVSQMAQAVQSMDPGARITSGYRPGAVTATGYPSYHGMGRAIDIVSPNMGRTWDMLARAFGSKAKELYYTPKGFIRNGRLTNDVAAVTRRNHYSHVHLALNQGGRLPGMAPANPREDNLLGINEHGMPVARVRSREWVVNQGASDYYGDGLMSAINARRIPREVLGSLPGLASGGAVGSANNSLDRARDRAERARERAREARKALREAEKAERKAKSDKAQNAAAKRVRDAEKKVEEAEKRLDERRDKVQAARDRRNTLRDQRRETTIDLRRGEIRDAVTSGSGFGVVDEMMDLGRSGDLGPKRSRNMKRVARQAESDLNRLYKQAERLEKRLEKAQDRVEDLKSIRDEAANSIRGGFSLNDDSVNPWTGKPEFTGSALASRAKEYAGKARKFSKMLGKMQDRGFSGVILREVAAEGIEVGTAMAEAMLSMSTTDRKTLNRAYVDIDRWSNQAGQHITEGFYRGGLSAAEGVVKGLEDQQSKIDAAVLRIAKRMERQLKKALGIKSPSRVVRDLMKYVGEGAVLGLQDQEPIVGDAAEKLLTLPSPSKFVGGAAAAAPAYYASSTTAGRQAVTVKMDKGSLAQAMDGMHMTLVADGKPISAIVRSEVAGGVKEAATVIRGGRR